MAWLAINKDGEECIMNGNVPYRDNDKYWISPTFINGTHWINNIIYLPKGSIKKLIKRKLNWEDEPVEI